MGINGSNVGALSAAVQVTSAGAIVTNSANLGFTKVAIAASVYTCTLDPNYQIDTLDSAIIATPTTDKNYVTAAQTADDTIVVKGWDATGAAADTGFHLVVFRKQVG